MTRIVLLVALLVAPARALAQPTVDDARRLFTEGVAAARAKNWEEAHDRFNRSYQAAPRVMTLFNLAGAQKNTLRLVAARVSYGRFLEQTSDGGQHVAYRRDAQREVDELSRRIPVLTVTVAGLADGDAVELDGRPLDRASLETPLPVDPGEHVLLVRRADHVVAREVVRAEEAARPAVELRVPLAAPRVTPEPPPPTPAVAVTAPPPQRDDDAAKPGLLRSPWFWAAAGIVVIGAGAGVGYYLFGDGEDGGDPHPGTLGTIDL